MKFIVTGAISVVAILCVTYIIVTGMRLFANKLDLIRKWIEKEK